MFEKIKSSINQVKQQFLAMFWVTFVSTCTRLKLDNRAVGMKSIIMALVGLSVGLYVAASILPSAIIEITNSSTWTGAPTVVVTLATTVVGIISIVALIMLILKYTR